MTSRILSAKNGDAVFFMQAMLRAPSGKQKRDIAEKVQHSIAQAVAMKQAQIMTSSTAQENALLDHIREGQQFFIEGMNSTEEAGTRRFMVWQLQKATCDSKILDALPDASRFAYVQDSQKALIANIHQLQDESGKRLNIKALREMAGNVQVLARMNEADRFTYTDTMLDAFIESHQKTSDGKTIQQLDQAIHDIARNSDIMFGVNADQREALIIKASDALVDSMRKDADQDAKKQAAKLLRDMAKDKAMLAHVESDAYIGEVINVLYQDESCHDILADMASDDYFLPHMQEDILQDMGYLQVVGQSDADLDTQLEMIARFTENKDGTVASRYVEILEARADALETEFSENMAGGLANADLHKIATMQRDYKNIMTLKNTLQGNILS